MIKVFFTEEKNLGEGGYYFKVNLDVGQIKNNDANDNARKIFVEKLAELKELAKTEEIKIYYDDLAESTCGMHAIINLLCNADAKIYTIKLLKKNAVWQDIADEDIDMTNAFERKLTIEEMIAISMDWAVCVDENADLRAVVNGKVISVNENFYDEFIIKNIKPGECISMYILMARTIAYCPNRNSKFILERINKLVQKNVFTITDRNENFYKSMIKLED